MNKTKKENGYALIIVLFAIIFIVTLTALFMRGSLSNIKQEYRAEESNLTVTAAEAGVDYYSWELEQVYNVNKSNFNDFAERIINTAIKEKKEPDYKYIQSKIAAQLKEELWERSKELMNNSYLLSDYEHKLELTKNDIELNGLEESKSSTLLYITVKGNVIATFDGEYEAEKTLGFQQRYTIPSFDGEKASGDIELGQIIDVPKWILETRPEKDCKKTPSPSKIEKSCYADEANKLSNLKEIEENAYLYKKGDLEIQKKLEIQDKGKIFVSDNLVIKKKFDIQDKSQVFVGKDLIMKNDEKESKMELEDNSYLFVTDNVNTPNKLDMQDKSYFYVGRNLTISKEIDMQDKSKLFIGGKLSFSTEKSKIELQDNAKICAVDLELKNVNKIELQGASRIYYLKTTDTDSKLNDVKKKIIKVNSLEELKKACGVVSSGSSISPPSENEETTDLWDPPVLDSVTY